ncbi:corticoliberin isoform X1 [Corvus kubaryi]|uniref:corticoliberin isoform X1 n=2 Tax=Corvus kubaryi TaxID=68294 RepID=UPI001C040DE6|nr:corticoliberin isoform X1 [Corvus kubaryi]
MRCPALSGAERGVPRDTGNCPGRTRSGEVGNGRSNPAARGESRPAKGPPRSPSPRVGEEARVENTRGLSAGAQPSLVPGSRCRRSPEPPRGAVPRACSAGSGRLDGAGGRAGVWAPIMKIPLLVSTGILLVALLPCQECRALSKSPAPAPGALHQPDFFQQQQQQQQQTLPVLLRMGEEYFLRLGNLHKRPVGSFSASSSSTSHLHPEASASNFFRAAVQQLQQLPERSPGSREEGEAEGEAVEREKRSEEPPISLDLTFHLLREVLEMARAEQLAQQAHSNRKLMEIIGK